MSAAGPPQDEPLAAGDVQLPVLDLSPENCSHALARELKAAAGRFGFFVVRNHGIPTDVFDRVYAAARAFFARDDARKRRVLASGGYFGYTPWGDERLDPATQKQHADTKEAFSMFRPIPPSERQGHPNPLQGHNQWPLDGNGTGAGDGSATEFKRTLLEYYEQVHRLALRLVELVALSLGLPRFALHPLFARPTEVLRLLHYAARRSDPGAGLLGAGAHTDYGFLTLLSTDGQPGLEVLLPEDPVGVCTSGDGGRGGGGGGDSCGSGSDSGSGGSSSSSSSRSGGGGGSGGRWRKVLPGPHDLVVNVGDFLHVLTDGRFRSATHRVVSTGRAERFSIPFFFEPNFDTPMRKPTWDGDGDSDGGDAFYTYGEHLLRKYKATTESSYGVPAPAKL